MEISENSVYLLHDIWTGIRPYVNSSLVFDENSLDETIFNLHKNFLEHIDYLEITIDDLAEKRNEDIYNELKEANERISDLEDEIDDLENSLEAMQEENEDLKQQIQDLQK